MKNELSFSRVNKLRHGNDINQVLAARGRTHENDLVELLKSGSSPPSLEKLRLEHFKRGLKLAGILDCGVKIIAKPDFTFIRGVGGVITEAHFIEIKLRGHGTGSDRLQGMFDLRAAEVDEDFGAASCDLTFCYGPHNNTNLLERGDIRNLDGDFDRLCLSAVAMLGWNNDVNSKVEISLEESQWWGVFAATAPQLPKLQQIKKPADVFYKAYEKITS